MKKCICIKTACDELWIDTDHVAAVLHGHKTLIFIGGAERPIVLDYRITDEQLQKITETT